MQSDGEDDIDDLDYHKDMMMLPPKYTLPAFSNPNTSC